MKEVKISVPNMQSTHCQTRVKNAIKEIEGVQIQNVAAGKLTVLVASDNTKVEVVNAIEKAGYAVSLENENSLSDCSTGCCNN
ncbi:MAG: heavy-metal-associated domain-containing protein [Flavobacteriaceae bacterium]|nr:heavy-metal-associated domain-containing protein [Flavobacteriaceae bacterium]